MADETAAQRAAFAYITAFLKGAPSMSSPARNNRVERRQAARVDASIPIRLSSTTRTVHAESTNLSRVGTLLRIQLSELGLTPEAPLEAVADSLRRVLGDLSRAEFRYDELGGLIARTLRMVRIARAGPDQDWVEIGCALRRPLGDEEVGVLRLDLPRVRWPKSTGEELEDETVEPMQMVIAPMAGHAVEPLATELSELTAKHVRGRLTDASDLPVCGKPQGASTVLSALTTEYGADPHVSLLKEDELLWTGHTHIECVEMDPADGRIQIAVAFDRRLSLPELAKLAS